MKSWPLLAPFGKNLATAGGNLAGGSLFYYDNGAAASDKPAVILVHGLGDEADTWRHVFPLLGAAGYRVIALDLPGFGRSVWKGRISMHCHCMSIINLMISSGAASPECPAIIAGNSLGAGITEMTACLRPDLIKKLILISGCFPFPGSIEKGFFRRGLPFLGKKWYRGFRKNHEAAWKSLYPYYSNLDAMSSADRDFLRERVIARVESGNQEHGYLSTVRSMNRFLMFGKQSISRKIKSYPGKIAIIWGEDDKIFPPEKTSIIRKLRPDAGFTFIPGAGHLPQQEKPEACTAQMLRFLSD